MKSVRPAVILMADDDPDDVMLTRAALQNDRLSNDIRSVGDGIELLDYLHRRGAFSDPGSAPTPDLILLDLNMPRMDGREALQELKQDERLRKIPVVVLTTSSAEEDVLRTYDFGANSYITKPVTFDGLREALNVMQDYWFQLVRLPLADD